MRMTLLPPRTSGPPSGCPAQHPLAPPLPPVSIYPDSDDGFEETYHAPACHDADLPPPPTVLGTERSQRYAVPDDAKVGQVVERPTLRLAVVARLAEQTGLVFSDDLRRALTALTNPAVFREVVLRQPEEMVKRPRQRHPVSTFHGDVLRQIAILTTPLPATTGPGPEAVARLYFVPKRGEDAAFWRVIFATLTLNELSRQPPRAPIPDLRLLIERLMSARWAIRLDFRSWFFQFGLSAAVASKWFAWTWAPTRARASRQRFRFDRLAMGWTWSVFIACATAVVLLVAGSRAATTGASADDAEVWVDDGVIFDTEIGTLCRRGAAIRETLDAAGAVLKVWEGPTDRFTLVGVDFDLRVGRWRLTEKWVDGFRRGVAVVTGCRRGALGRFWRLVGCAVWACFAQMLPYALVQPALADLHDSLRSAPLAHIPADDIMIDVSSAAAAALQRVAAVTGQWRRLPGPWSSSAVLFTDGSVVGGGVVNGIRTIGWPWGGRNGPLDQREQQRAELRTIRVALAALASGMLGPVPPAGCIIYLLTDSVGSAWRLARWQSAGPDSEDIVHVWNILAAAQWQLRIGHVPGVLTPADRPSRWGAWHTESSGAEAAVGQYLPMVRWLPRIPSAPTIQLPTGW